MPEIRPFRGIRYDPSVVGPLEHVVAPPYDVISPEEQARLYDASPYNVVRLDLSRDADRYASAATTFRDWLARGVLAREREPALYGYAQRHRLKEGAVHERVGFFARLHLEDFSSRRVLPHEKTLAGAKADRLALQHACRANLSPIFGLYSSPGWSLAERLRETRVEEPLLDAGDAAGVHHRFWRIRDGALHRELADRVVDRTVYIADGHHRYETALRYRDELRTKTGRSGADEPFEWVLAFLCNVEEPGLVVLPTHRMLRELPLATAKLGERLASLFRVERARPADLESRMKPAARDERRIGVILHGEREALVLVTRDGENDARLAGSTTLRRLDVTLLHGLVLEGPASILGLDAHGEAEAGRLVYTKDAAEAVGRVACGEFAAAFLLNATRVEEVRQVSEAGETMPEKSTYFYPKLLTGLVFNPLED